MGTGQVEVQGRADAQVVTDLSAVELGDTACGVGHRDNEGPGQVLVATLAIDAEGDEATPECRPGLGLAIGEAQPEGPVGVAEAEVLDGLGVVDLAALQIGEGLGGLGQGGAVVGDHLGEGLGVVDVEGDRGRKTSGSRVPRPGHHRGLAGAQQLERVAEAHPLGLHHPVDGTAPGLAGPHAVPETLGRGDHERGGVVVVERAAAHKVPAGPLEEHPRTGDQFGQVDLFFQPLHHLVGDAGHGLPPQKSFYAGVTTHW